MEKLSPGWQTFDHVADIGIRGIGYTVEEAFENGAHALFSLLVDNPASIECRNEIDIECSSFDLTALFVAWINKLISISDMKHMVFGRFRVVINANSLSGKAIGEKWSVEKHGRGIEVKGATFTEALVEKREGLWIAQCVVDV